MKPIDGSNWLRRPWRLMSHGDCYRHYCKRTELYEENLIVSRSSDKCYKVTRWKIPHSPFAKPTIVVCSFRNWREVEYYAQQGIEYIKEISNTK